MGDRHHGKRSLRSGGAAAWMVSVPSKHYEEQKSGVEAWRGEGLRVPYAA